MRAFAKSSLRKDGTVQNSYSFVPRESMGSRPLEGFAEYFELRKWSLKYANLWHISKSGACGKQTESEREHRKHRVAGDVCQNKSAA